MFRVLPNPGSLSAFASMVWVLAPRTRRKASFSNGTVLRLVLTLALIASHSFLCGRGWGQEENQPSIKPPTKPNLGDRLLSFGKKKEPVSIEFIRNLPGESKPITIEADRVGFWKQNGETVITMEGKVFIQQGFINIRLGKAVAWINPRQYQLTGIWKMEMQAEDDIRLDASTDVRKADHAYIELYTRGEIKLSSIAEKANREPNPTCALVEKMSGERQKRKELARNTKGEKSPTALGKEPVEKSSFWSPALKTPGTDPGFKPAISPSKKSSPTSSPPPSATGEPQSSAAPLNMPDSALAKSEVETRVSFFFQPPPLPPPTGAGVPEQGVNPNNIPAPAPVSPLFNPSPAPGAASSPAAPAPAAPSSPLFNPATVSPQAAPPSFPSGTAPPGGNGILLPAPSPPGGSGPLPWSSSPGAGSTPSMLVDPANIPQRTYTITPRGSSGFRIMFEPVSETEQAIILTGGAVLQVKDLQGIGLIDMEADRVIIWTKGSNPQQVLANMQNQAGQTSKDLEFYLSGNVEIRQMDKPLPPRVGVADQRVGDQLQRTMRASEIYYDVRRNQAIALSAELEFHLPLIPDPVIVRADELQQLDVNQYRVIRSEIFSSRTPGDPGLKVFLTEATIEDKKVPKPSFLGALLPESLRPAQTQEIKQTYVKGTNAYLKLGDVPIFYVPWLQGDARDPLGPVEGINLGFNRIYGGQFGIDLNTYDLFGLTAPAGTRWRWSIDELTARGPATGTDFDFNVPDLFGLPAKWSGLVTAYGLYDNSSMGPFGTRDILGGNRFDFTNPDHWRGRVSWRQTIEPTNWSGFSFKSQIAGLSDRNFQEQFFKQEYDNDLSQLTFFNARQQAGAFGYNILAEPRLRYWVNETAWLPKANGFVTGYDLFNIFTYSANGGVGYAMMKTTNDPTPQFSPTDVGVTTGRFNLFQELSAPINAGPVKITPYLKGDMAYYTSQIGEVANTTVNGSRGLTDDSALSQFWGGFGARINIPTSRLYSDIKSDMFNLDGVYHKTNFGMNYFYSASSQFYQNLPQLDRFNDDATDMAMRDWVYFIGNPGPSPYVNIFGTQINPANAAYNPVWFQNYSQRKYDPQNYGIRSGIDNRIDTLNSVQTLQMTIAEKWQTKRGMPGNQHTVDFLTLDVGTTLFPQSDRDNFGELFGLYNYDLVWNPGDRTAIVSSGWMDSFQGGAQVVSIGGFYNRDDRTNLYLGYRYYNPLDSRLLTAALNYVFSPKYAMTATTNYDFGTSQALSSSLALTRMGKDLQVSVGLTYNATTNNFGLTFQILPILATYGNRMQRLNLGGGI